MEKKKSKFALKKAELTYIYGVHAVKEVLRKRPDVVSVVYIRDSLLADPKLRAQANRAGSLLPLDERRLPEGIPHDAVHQGMIAGIAMDKLLVEYKTFKENLSPTPDTAVVVLGEVQDPHNVGAIIRSAAAFGISAILIPEHRQAPVTGTVIKVSAGMAFSVPLVSIGNVNTALRDLKNRGFWVYGLDSKGTVSLTEEKFDRPSVFVVGNEGTGMREKTREVCDTVLTIPMHPRAESLNASVSAAVVFYAWNTAIRQ
ncbi:MAG: 23S rRNA (guanosine(2251)-2'-O)-methyltransferase RlmB [Candidatus Paceibacterota bacterium]